MIRQKTLTSSGALDPLPTLDRPTNVTIAMFEIHRSDATCCAICGTGRCGEVVLADHNLAVL